ncbi:MAG: sulfotransferase [Thermodesulfobacteriota bacterium]|nr:sulfotransferase [Thermodesulfobacteriota bacterium]
MSISDPIFICGAGRSGTSLMQSMLGSHSEIVVFPETAFVRRFIANPKTLDSVYRKEGLRGILGVLQSDPKVGRLNIDLSALIARHFTDESRSGVVAVKAYESILRHYLKTSGKRRIGDKDPKLVEYLPLVKRHWGESYIIHVIRDPKDVLASKKRAEWSRRKPWLLHILANRTQVKMGRELGPKLFGHRYQEVIYERLISDPEEVLTEVCRNLDVGYEPAMLKFSVTAREIVSSSEVSWKKETLGPLLPGNTRKWKGPLSAFEAALTDAVCEDALGAGGYESSGCIDRMSGYRRAVVWGGARLIEIMDALYRRWRLCPRH